MSTPVSGPSLWWIPMIALISLQGCKEQVTDVSMQAPAIASLEADPAGLRFDPLLGNRDTTVVVSIELSAEGWTNAGTAGFTVRERGVVLATGGLEPVGDGPAGSRRLAGRFDFDTQTSRSRAVDIHAYVFDTDGRGEVWTWRLVQTGFPTLPPSIESIVHPAEVVLPTSGSSSIRFEVKAVHPVDQKLMDGVFMYLVDSASNRIPSDGSTFRLFDDGFSQLSAGRDDRVASDSVFTIVLSVNSTNKPDSYTLHWYPRDLSGLVGDTLKSTLTFLPPP